MDGGGVSLVKFRKSSRDFTTVLASAFLEWLLIFMLLLNAIVAYLITKFARYCELPIPCLLCSRLDHVLGGERVGFYWDLICQKHKSEISSLVLCKAHGKLVDAHGMCENCLFSFAMKKDESVAETYSRLVGKLRPDPGIDIDEAPLLDDHHKPTASRMKCCSCCDEFWSSRSLAQKLLQAKSAELYASDLDVPLFIEFRQNANNMKNQHGSAANSSNAGTAEDSLPYFGYSGLKITSDTESEGHRSDNEDLWALIHETNNHQHDIGVESVQADLQIPVLAEDSTNATTINLLSLAVNEDLGTLIGENNNPQEDLRVESVQMEPVTTTPAVASPHVLPSFLVLGPAKSTSQVQSGITEHHDGPSDAFASAIGNGFEEPNWQEVDSKAHPYSLDELINVNNAPASSNPGDQLKTPPPSQTELININGVNESSKFGEVSVFQSEDNADIRKAGDIGQTQVDEIHHVEPKPITADAMGSKMNTGSNDSGLQTHSYLDLGDAYKLAVSNRGKQFSGKLLEQARKDSTRITEDLKLLLSQLSSPRGLELPFNMISPRVSGNLEELKTFDSPAANGMQVLQKRISLERNESGTDSLDLSIVSEIEGETELDRLKRQADHDKRLMSALCKELEEERNASAVAANHAMAMITRLQEEKATLQMEALHDLRMMEDQAEYDMEALQKLNSLLTEKEKEIQDLEAELEFYKRKFPDKPPLENKLEPAPDTGHAEELTSVSNHSASEQKGDLHDGDGVISGESNIGSSKDLWLEFEDEKLYISRCLNKLEKKLHLFSNNGVYSNLTNGDCFGKEGEDLSDSKWHKEGSQMTSELEENDLFLQTDAFISKGSQHTLVRHTQSLKSSRSVDQASLINKETDMVILGYEVLSLNNRLHALEADRNFLEHALNSLRNGDEGLQFIQEIASHLRELRRIGISRQRVLP